VVHFSHRWRCVFNGIAALSFCVTAMPLFAAETAWKPRKTVEIVVGAQAAGANDRMGRMLHKILTDTNALPVPSVVVNKPGQGQALSVAYLNTHVADPHYVVILGSSWVTTSIATGGVTHRELTPIAKLVDTDLVMFVSAASPVRSVKELVEGLAKNVGAYSFGFSTSAGNASHIALAELARIAGADSRKLRLVVNTSGSITATQVGGGHVSAGLSSSGSAAAMVASGKARLIGTPSTQRLPQLPDLPTLREQGFDVVASTWFTIFGPKGISAEQVAYWEDVFFKAMRHPEAKKFADGNNWTVELMGAKALRTELDKEYARLRKTLTELGLVQ
jgi:putative tricarboxylic transport membrane protein